MKNALPVILLVAGCGSTTADYKPVRTEDGIDVYSIETVYGGDKASRVLALEWLDTEAKNLCESGYKRISAESVPLLNHLQEVISSRIIWEIKCNLADEERKP